MKRPTTVAAAGIMFSMGLSILGFALAADQLAEPQLPEITIEARPIPVTTVVGRSSTGVSIERMTVDHYVSYADLDLVKPADVQTLNKRVESAAHNACQQLDELYPLQAPKLGECTKTAIHGASEQIEKAIAGAHKRSSK